MFFEQIIIEYYSLTKVDYCLLLKLSKETRERLNCFISKHTFGFIVNIGYLVICIGDADISGNTKFLE